MSIEHCVHCKDQEGHRTNGHIGTKLVEIKLENQSGEIETYVLCEDHYEKILQYMKVWTRHPNDHTDGVKPNLLKE